MSAAVVSRLWLGTLRLVGPMAAGLALTACVTAPPPPPRTVEIETPQPQKIFVYPSNGQSQEQTDRDRYECHLWAVQQTGVDPSRSDGNPYERVVVQPSSPVGAGTAAGAVGGAILGALIAGPRAAGAGLLLGGATGAIVGTAADASVQQQQANMTQAQIDQQVAAGHARAEAYTRALGACLQGRGYTIS